jgi:RimJ/RimL family protein N-acetyltransferase
MITVRRGERADLAGLRRVLARIAEEPDAERHVPIEPDEVESLAAGMLPLLDRDEDTPGAMFVAVASGARSTGEIDTAEPIGWVTMRGSDRKRLAHQCTLGISVDRAHRGRGVGRALMAAAIAWARDAQLARIELRVMTRHTAAIALYEAMGFVHEGTVRGGIRIAGQLHDDYVMGLLL